MKITDKIALGVILLHAVLLFLNWDKLPNDQRDWTYHLMVAKMFAEKGSFLWDVYEYAPVGRPHLYPPLLHLVFAFTHVLGLDWLGVQRLYGVLIYSLSLLVVWFVARDFFGDKVALLSVLILNSSESYFWWQASAAPTSLVFALYPLLIWAFLRNEKLAILILAAMFWTHLASPWLGVLAILLISIVKKEPKRFLRVFGIALLSFLPWALHVFRYRDWIHHEAMTVTGVNIGLLMGVFGIVGLYALLKSKRPEELAILAGVAALLPTAYTYSWRFWIHFPAVFALVAGVGLKRIADDFGGKGFLAAMLLLLAVSLVVSPSVNIQKIPSERPFKEFIPRGGEPQEAAGVYIMTLKEVQPPLRIEIEGLLGDGRILRTSPHVSADALAVYAWIEENTLPGEILHVDEGFLGCAISVFTDRRTDNGAWKEVLQPWVLREARSADIRYGVVVRKPGKPLPGKSIIEVHGRYAIVNMSEYRRLQPRAPPFILELVKLSEPLKKAAGEVATNPREASRTLLDVASSLRKTAGMVKKPRVKRDLLNTAAAIEELAREIPIASPERRTRIARTLDMAGAALERGDVRGALLIIQEKTPRRLIR